MKRTIALALILGASLAGCSSSDSDSTGAIGSITKQGTAGVLEMTLTPKAEVAQGKNEMTLHLQSVATGKDVTGAACTLGVTMPSMAMDSPGAMVMERSGGDYQVMDVDCSMAGAWELAFHCAAGEMADDATFDFDVR